MSWKRESVVAGTFYPGEKHALVEVVEAFCSHDDGDKSEPRTTVAIVSPHAGYVYSGRIAGAVYARIRVPDSVFVLCPNHTGYGKRVAVWSQGEWVTPLGKVMVDQELANIFLEKAGETEGDREAHLAEHAAEVQMPFLQFLNPKVKIVPVTLGALRWEQCERVSRALALAVQSRPEGSVLMVASTDMSHYVPAKIAKERDGLALKKLGELDGKGLYDTVVENDISMCGFIPTSCVLEAASNLGARHVEIVRYGHSGEVTGDSASVVAYVSAMVY